MILETCLALLLLALACLCFSGLCFSGQCFSGLFRARPRAGIALLTAGLLLLELAGSGLLAQALLPLVRLANPIEAIPWAPHSTIVVLGAGTTAPTRIDGQLIPPGVKKMAFSRIMAGARAWRACHAHGADCTIIVTGGDPSRHGASEASVYAPVLADLGIPAELIRQEGASNTTWENARNTTRMVPQTRQLVVVTSGIHLARALILFDHYHPHSLGIASDITNPGLTLVPSANTLEDTEMVLHELLGIAQFRVYTTLGWGPR